MNYAINLYMSFSKNFFFLFGVEVSETYKQYFTDRAEKVKLLVKINHSCRRRTAPSVVLVAAWQYRIVAS